VVAFGMYWFADSFADCLLAEFVDALGTTLATGALDAWVVDEMRAEGDHRPPGRVFARAQLLATPAMIVSGLAGAYVADIDIAAPWPIGAALFGTTGLVALAVMREPPLPRSDRTSLWRSWVRTTTDGFATVRRLPILATLCALTAATSFAVMPAWHYWPARLQDLSGQGIWLLGWVWVLISLAAMAGNALMPRLVQKFAPERVLAVASTLRGAALGVAVLVPRFPQNLVAVLMLQAVYGLMEPALQGWMNENVDSKVRATVLSVRSMAFTLGGGVGLLCIGLVARSGGISAAWGVSALLILLSAPGYLLLGRRAQRPASLAVGGGA